MVFGRLFGTRKARHKTTNFLYIQFQLSVIGHVTQIKCLSDDTGKGKKTLGLNASTLYHNCQYGAGYHNPTQLLWFSFVISITTQPPHLLWQPAFSWQFGSNHFFQDVVDRIYKSFRQALWTRNKEKREKQTSEQKTNAYNKYPEVPLKLYRSLSRTGVSNIGPAKTSVQPTGQLWKM